MKLGRQKCIRGLLQVGQKNRVFSPISKWKKRTIQQSVLHNCSNILLYTTAFELIHHKWNVIIKRRRYRPPIIPMIIAVDVDGLQTGQRHWTRLNFAQSGHCGETKMKLKKITLQTLHNSCIAKLTRNHKATDESTQNYL